MQIETLPIKKLSLWKDNPRVINEDDFNILKHRLQDKGQFKPLIVDEQNTVLGGNMRLRAMQELGWQTVDVVRVHPQSEQERIWYALVDNERSGYYQEDKLAELTLDIPQLDDIKVNLETQKELSELKDIFRPSENEEEIPSELNHDDEVKCPNCGHKFVV